MNLFLEEDYLESRELFLNKGRDIINNNNVVQEESQMVKEWIQFINQFEPQQQISSSFFPAMSLSGPSGCGKSFLIQQVLQQQCYSVIHWYDLYPDDPKESFLKHLALTLLTPRTAVLIDDCETMTSAQLITLIAFLRRCRQVMIHKDKDKNSGSTNNTIETGMRLRGPVIFIAEEREYRQPRLQVLYPICQHWTMSYDTTTMYKSLLLSRKIDDSVLREKMIHASGGNWHRLNVMLQWYAVSPDIEFSFSSSYDSFQSSPQVLQSLLSSSTDCDIKSMKQHSNLSMQIWEHQWTLQHSNVSFEAIAAWSNHLSLLNVYEHTMAKSNKDAGDEWEVARALSNSQDFALLKHVNVLPNDNEDHHNVGPHINTNGYIQDNIYSLSEEQQREHTAVWIHSMNKVIPFSSSSSSSSSPNTAVISKNNLKRKHQKKLEHIALPAEQMPLSTSQQEDHLVKQHKNLTSLCALNFTKQYILSLQSILHHLAFLREYKPLSLITKDKTLGRFLLKFTGLSNPPIDILPLKSNKRIRTT